MKKRLSMVALLVALVACMATLVNAAPATKAAPTNPFTNIPVTGTYTDANGPGTFSGTLNIQRFASAGGRNLVAIGTLSGTLTEATGTTQQVTDQAVTLPVARPMGQSLDAAAPSASCPILHLVLGPLNLNLLGLQVTLNQVVLNINAIPGAGNLLGNLLCSVANLLNGNASASAVATLLNQILTILNGLLGGL